MKRGEEADEQYRELAAALQDVEADWVVEEVEDVVRRGKTIPFRDLPRDERARYAERVRREAARGFEVSRPKATDEVGVPLDSAERLDRLVDATNRVIQATVRSHACVADFARANDLQFVAFEEPVGIDVEAAGERRDISLIDIVEVEAHLDSLDEILRNRVLE